MARTRKTNEIKTEAYRHSGDKRKNIPLAKIAAEGVIPVVKKARYYYSPHLDPTLRFDPTGKADQVMIAKEKADQYLTESERKMLGQALTSQHPWLEWAEKKEQHDRGWFEVDPVALHIHERISAQAIIRTAMREDAQRDLFADPQLSYQQEVQFYRHDIDWANRLVLGDSFQVMSSLARRENLAGKVQMIYIDPPYGIRFASNFQPAVGRRDVKDKPDDLSREPETVKAYRDTWALGVHSYLGYLRDRLVVARELLTDTGSIFVQISDDNLHRLKALMDEVFGSENSLGLIMFEKTTSATTQTLPNVADYILWYGKDHNVTKYHQLYAEKVLGEEGTTQYVWIENNNGIERRLTDEDIDADNMPKSDARIFACDNLTSQRPAQGTDVKSFCFRGGAFAPGKGTFKTDKPGLDRLAYTERLKPIGNSLMYKRFLADFPVSPIANVWRDVKMTGFSEDKVYVVQTGLKVISRCLLMTTDPGDLVLDPTCGSGTTAVVAEQWGRRWITADTSRVAIAIARQRLLTSKFEYYRCREDSKGVSSGFRYKSVPHITLGSIARNRNLDPIFAKHEVQLIEALKTCAVALTQLSDKVRVTCRQKLLDKEARQGKRFVTDADRRRWELPKKGGKWEHWEIPYDTDPDWPAPLQDAVTAYRKAWRIKMDDVNTCIARNAEQEELVDQPEVVKGILRVAGPFTLEGVRPEEMSLGESGLFDGTPNDWEVQDARDEVQNVHAYLYRMIDLLRKDGVTFPNNKHLKFERLEALYETKTGTALHAEGNWGGTDEREPNKVGVAFGPQYGPVTAEQVEELIRASKRYDELVIAGFSFDSEASGVIQEGAHPKLKIHMAHIRPDVSPGMDGLLKDTPNSQLFTVFGQPEIIVKMHGKDDVQVELLGVDIFDPLKGEVRSTGADKVAAWFLDSDYDGRCFCITQAFFPDQDAWVKIAKALGSSADEDAFDAFKGTVSLPFKPGKHHRIAVKVIDPRGNEVMAIEKLGDA